MAEALAPSPPREFDASTLIPIAKQTFANSVTFTGQANFRRVLNQRVQDYIATKGLKTRDLPKMYAKSVMVSLWWAASYALWIFSGVTGLHWSFSLAFAASFALAMVGLGFNIMHDANHSGYSNNPRVNRILGYTCELVGLSTFIWRQQHNIWHHTYTNIAGLDEGLETDGWLRSSPRDVWKPLHRYQHFFAPIVYAMAGVGLMTVRNLTVYFTGKSSEHFIYPKMSRHDKTVFWAGRALNLVILFIIPVLVFPWWQAAVCFVVLSVTAGSVMAHILMLAHVSDAVEYIEPVGDPLKIENEWAIHQVVTTLNFAERNALVTWYVGGLNYQIEHHLFPHICHLVYPEITGIVQQTCHEFGVTYNSNPSLLNALKEHYRSLKQFGQKPTGLTINP